MELPSTENKIRPIAFTIIGLQLIVTALFFLTVLTREPTYSALSILDIDPLVMEGIAGAFQRYSLWLTAAFFISAIFTYLDISSSQLSKGRKIALYTTMAFFLFYLILTRALQFPWNQDDAYIDFRYVINWVNNLSFDYNPGQRAMGFTSHLHLALLTPLALIFKSIDLPIISQGLNITLQIISYYLTYYLVRAVTGNQIAGCLGAIILALYPYNIQETMGGKEAMLVSTCMLVSLLGIHYKRVHLVGWFSALIVLTRPEGGLWLILSMIWSYKNFKSKAFIAWIGPIMLLLAVALWLFSQFGTIVPHSFVGKSNMFYKPPLMMDMVLILRRLGDGCFIPELNYPMDKGLSDIVDFFRLYGGTLVLLALLKFLDKGCLRFYAIAVFCYFLLISIANPYLFPWYLAWFALVPSILIPVLFLKLVALKKEQGNKKNAIIASVLIVYLLGLQLIQQPTRPVAGLPAITFFWSGAYKRLIIYRKAAEHAKRLDPEEKSVLGAPEIGVLGHYYRGPILDLGGLVSNGVIKYAPPSQDIRVGTSLFSIIPETIEDLKPRFLVTDGFFGQKGLYKQKFFKYEYRVAEFFPHKLWSEGIYLYELRSASNPNQNTRTEDELSTIKSISEDKKQD